MKGTIDWVITVTAKWIFMTKSMLQPLHKHYTKNKLMKDFFELLIRIWKMCSVIEKKSDTTDDRAEQAL